MSVCGGTRRKKISVLHMLGTWEGKIEGCNCPSCKEWDEGEKNIATSLKNRSKSSRIAQRVGSKGHPPKDLATNTHESETYPKKQIAAKNSVPIKTLKTSKVHGELDDMTDEAEKSSEGEGIETVGSGGHSQDSNAISDDNAEGDVGQEQSVQMNKQSGTAGMTLKKDLKVDMDEESQDGSVDGKNSTNITVVKRENVKLQSTNDPESSNKQNEKADKSGSPNIKVEPEEYFSDEETDVKPAKRKYAVTREPRMSKRAKMVTSEIENVYAKPRMIFTGRGVVRKFEPCLDRTPKSRRGRKPGKVSSSPVKIKQEPKEAEQEENEGEEDGGEMDQLQKALSEAAENISDVGDEFFDAFNDYEEGSKKVGRPRRRNNALFKRVEGDGDKYVECTMCFKMLKESSMKQHFKTHSGAKPHTCSECDARFTRKGDVERHKRLVHKNQKPFSCQKCNKDFSDRKNLKAHLQNHDKAIYYACNTCGFKFGKREYYENHIRYIHPLPDGVVPQFNDMEVDVATKQLRQIEMEEKQERKAKKMATGEADVLFPEDEEEDEDSQESDKDVEVTLNVDEQNSCSDGSLIIKKENDESQESQNEEIETQASFAEFEKVDNISRGVVSSIKPQVGTDVSVSKGTLSFTQTVPDTDSQDEELVDKVIAAAVSQATNTIESLQAKSGANLCENDADLMDEEEEEDEMLEEADDIQEMLDNANCEMVTPAPVQKQVQQTTEIHINASVSGQQRKFIIQVPPGTNLNVQTPDGMEMIVNIVNQLCAGKGELDGPIEVTMHNPAKEMLMLKKS